MNASLYYGEHMKRDNYHIHLLVQKWLAGGNGCCYKWSRRLKNMIMMSSPTHHLPFPNPRGTCNHPSSAKDHCEDDKMDIYIVRQLTYHMPSCDFLLTQSRPERSPHLQSTCSFTLSTHSRRDYKAKTT